MISVNRRNLKFKLDTGVKVTAISEQMGIPYLHLQVERQSHMYQLWSSAVIARSLKIYTIRASILKNKFPDMSKLAHELPNALEGLSRGSVENLLRWDYFLLCSCVSTTRKLGTWVRNSPLNSGATPFSPRYVYTNPSVSEYPWRTWMYRIVGSYPKCRQAHTTMCWYGLVVPRREEEFAFASTLNKWTKMSFKKCTLFQKWMTPWLTSQEHRKLLDSGRYRLPRSLSSSQCSSHPLDAIDSTRRSAAYRVPQSISTRECHKFSLASPDSNGWCPCIWYKAERT